jgi:hypothetical protein
LWDKKERDTKSNNNNTDTVSNSNKWETNGNGLERGFRKELDKGRRGDTGEKGKERKGKSRTDS